MSHPRGHLIWLILGLGVGLAGCGRTPIAPSTVVAPKSTPVPAKPDEPAAGRTLAMDAVKVRPDDWFEDVTETTGIRWTHRNGREGGRFFLIESFGGGAAMMDYDLDSDPDLFFTGGGTISAAPSPVKIRGLPTAMYRNDGSWRFVSVGDIAGFANPPDYTFGCTTTDFDQDGFPDLFLYCYGRCRLYRNQGDGTFVEADEARQLPAAGMWAAAVWGDVDRDSLPDLFLSRYVDWTPENEVHCNTRSTGERDLCGPSQYEPSQAAFFRNGGDAGFEDWTDKVGLQRGVKGLGLLAGDFNLDGFVDFYLANDETANHLYWGTADGRLTEGAWRAGVAAGELGLEEGSMGVDAGDVDGDGLPELWVVNYEAEDNALYRNRGEGLFEHASVKLGLAGTTRMRVRWGTSLTDFDGDGWLDILILNGHALYAGRDSPWEQVPQLFRNRAGDRFGDVSETAGAYFRQEHAGRGAAVGDLDDDGAVDFVAVHMNEPVRVLRNRKKPANFVSVRLRGTLGDRDSIGARATLVSGSDRPLTRFVLRGSGYASHSDDRLLFALNADAATADLVVHWPARATEIFRGLDVRRTNIVVEGWGEPY